MITLLKRATSFALLSVCLSGCSPSATDRREISGAVTYNGEPVANGTIYFETDVSKGNNGPQAVADIKDGSYKTRPEFGAVAGPHTVRIVIAPSGEIDPGDVRAKRKGAPPGEYVTTADVQPGVAVLDFALPFPKDK